MDPEKEKFLRNEFLTMSLVGALGRSRTYVETASEGDKGRFRVALRQELDAISQAYTSEVEEEEHVTNIEKLSDILTSMFPHCLRDGRFRIGIAQKALNLYLKYLWSVSLIPIPPHCPFDSIIISHLPECTDLNWTLLDNIDDYRRLVTAAKRAASGRSLAAWELELWMNKIQLARDGSSNQNRIFEQREIGVHMSGCGTTSTRFHDDIHQAGRANTMPSQGDAFRGQINDLSLDDAKGWRRRDIWFFKHELNRGESFGYPSQGDGIVLKDIEGERYELKFSKPDFQHKVCLGTPSKLKSWYQKKGFDYQSVKPTERVVFFEYTGHSNEFIILTEAEYNERITGVAT
jgi:hypothetical protein